MDKAGELGLVNFAEAKTLEKWKHPTEVTPTTLRIRIPPTPSMTDRLCICFSCEDMTKVLLRYTDFDMHLGIDVKQGTMTGQAGVATLSLQAKDMLRTTTFSKGNNAEKRRVQGRAYTTHGQPLLQAIFNTEETANFVHLFRALETIHDSVGDGTHLRDRVVALHSDYAPGIEAARKVVWTKSRPAKDQFHFAQHTGLKTTASGTLAKKMRHRHAVGSSGNHELTNLGWTVSALRSLRRIPTLDCASKLYEGFLARLHHELDEPDAADYLGPDSHGPQQYTIRGTVKEMKEQYNLRCYSTNESEAMLFCPNWTGLGLLTSGYEGSSVEPFHSPWEKARQDIATLAMKHSSLEILMQMQYLYSNCFGRWFSWDEDSPRMMRLYPDQYDPAHLNGAPLTAAGRSHAQALWLASKSQRVHALVLEKKTGLPSHYNPERTEVAAVAMSQHQRLVVADAEAGAALLFSSGDELQARLTDAGLLQARHATNNKKHHFLGTQMHRVNAVFNNIAYVIISSDASIFRACTRGPVCTCKWFCRHAGCEHVEYVAMLSLRLEERPRHACPQEIPGTRPRGRKRGATVVVPTQRTTKRRK